jgi:hypothetical protein
MVARWFVMVSFAPAATVRLEKFEETSAKHPVSFLVRLRAGLTEKMNRDGTGEGRSNDNYSRAS